MTNAMAYSEYVFYTTKTIYFKAPYWNIRVHGGTHMSSAKYLQKKKEKYLLKTAESTKRKLFEYLNLNLKVGFRAIPSTISNIRFTYN